MSEKTPTKIGSGLDCAARRPQQYQRYRSWEDDHYMEKAQPFKELKVALFLLSVALVLWFVL